MKPVRAEEAEKSELLEEIRSLYAFLDARHLEYEKAILFENRQEQPQASMPQVPLQTEKRTASKPAERTEPLANEADKPIDPARLKAAWHADPELVQAASRPNPVAITVRDVREKAETVFDPAAIQKQIEVFRQLFLPRKIMYYLQGRSGFFFVPCQNYNLPGCPKAKGEKADCRICPMRKQDDLDDRLIESHLRDIKPFAISPFYEDGTTPFLRLRFSGPDASRDYEEVMRAARARSLPCLGEAVKVSSKETELVCWMFFAMPIDGAKAARFGQAFLLDAFANGELGSLHALDSLSPSMPFNQTEAAREKIVLPLSGLFSLGEIVNQESSSAPEKEHAQKTEASDGQEEQIPGDEAAFPWFFESVLLDEQDRRDKKPMERIARMQRISPASVDGILGSVRDQALLSWFEADPTPLIAMPSSPATLFDAGESERQSDRMEPVRIEQHGRLYVQVDTLPVTLAMRIYALGCYWNPVYARKNARYVSGSRIIEHARKQVDEKGRAWISLPRYLLDSLIRLLDAAGYGHTLLDARQDGQPLDLHFDASLRPEQTPLLQALMQKEQGILEAATGTGKTVIGAALIARRKVSALVLVNSKEILQGWVKALNQFLRFDNPEDENWEAPSKNYPGKIGVLQGATNSLSGRVDIAMVPSLVRKKDLDDILSRYGMILVDECHHAGSPTYQEILDRTHCRYIYGFSATPSRTDQKSASVFWQLGDVLASFSSKEQMKKQSFFRLMMPRVTPFFPSIEKEDDFTRLAQEAAEHPLRNEMIIDDVLEALENGRTVLVLTRFVDHANRLADRLKPQLDEQTDLFVYAGNPKDKQDYTKQLQQRAEEQKSGRKTVLIGTYSSVSEGFDFPLLDTLMLALPIAAKTSISQSIGRIHRQIDSKQVVIVYDYLDASVPMFERMYHTRAMEYSTQGYQIGAAESWRPPLRDGLDFYEEAEGIALYSREIRKDVGAVQKNIALMARQIDPKKMKPVLSLLRQRAEQGVRCDLFAERMDDKLKTALEQEKMHVHIHPRISTMALILDSETVYYGNIYSKTALRSGQAFRLISRLYAGELLEARRQAERELRRMEKEKMAAMQK